MRNQIAGTDKIEQDKAGLRQAWDDLISDLQKARDIIDSPDFFAPPATSRVLAEGYRYLSGFIHHSVERAFHEDPDFPAFRNALSIFNKSTIDNPDAIYFYAPIDGSKRYLVKARLEDSRHWRGLPRVTEGRLAPQYLIFETSNGPLSGDTGDLNELTPGFRTGFGTLDSSGLQVDEDGELELLLAPEKPVGFAGNFIYRHLVVPLNLNARPIWVEFQTAYSIMGEAAHQKSPLSHQIDGIIEGDSGKTSPIRDVVTYCS